MDLLEIAYGLTVKALECGEIFDEFEENDIDNAAKAKTIAEFYNTILENLNPVCDA